MAWNLSQNMLDPYKNVLRTKIGCWYVFIAEKYKPISLHQINYPGNKAFARACCLLQRSMDETRN